ncbi:MAG: hypothetical protein KGL39_42530 [Patescibacteria group bacterium]|nr:hypothetical protein [Patescibacteria group bacterium]
MELYTNLCNRLGIETERECLSLVRHGDGWASVVRPTRDGQFAVLMVAGHRAKLLKMLPTLPRARAYNIAIGKNS